jgi:ferric-dicitrate binding protein FerR (iron transport regulator)
MKWGRGGLIIGCNFNMSNKAGRKIRTIGGLCAVAVMCGLARLAADQPAAANLALQASLGGKSKLWLVGDSTLHMYSSTAAKIDASIEFQPVDMAVGGALADVPSDGQK